MSCPYYLPITEKKNVGVMVSMVDRGFKPPTGSSKKKPIKLAFAASPLSMQH